MTSMDSAHYFNINYYVTFSLSLGFNTLLMWLIKQNPSNKLKNYSSVLVQGVVLDVLTSFVFVSTQTYFECTQGYIFYESIAPWSFIFEAFTRNIWSIPVITFSALPSFSNPIQALYRYFHFCLHITLKPIHIFGLYFACFVCLTATGAMHILAYDRIVNVPKAAEVIREMPYWHEHGDQLKNFYVANLLNIYIIFSVVIILIELNSAAAFLVFFNNRVNSYLKSLRTHMASKTIQLQRQISRQLMFQFCLPGLLGVVGLTSACCLMFLPEYSGGFVMLMYCPFQWVPVLNPLITIMCIADYRRQLFRFFKKKNIHGSSAIVVPTATGHVDSKIVHGSGAIPIPF